MLTKTLSENTVEKKYSDYLSVLQASAFCGEIRTDYASRLAVATDNSVYQVIPQAVILPKSTNDISIALQLCEQPSFQDIKFSPRGGGTATNGQSLSAGIIIDCSKYMCEIIELNLQEMWVRVQPGVVLDQLNAYLKVHSMHFAPEISPSNRATLGGMINTDACGNGSKVIGRTSDHVVNLTCVLSDGRIIQTDKSDVYQTELLNLLQSKQQLISERFVSRPRNLNGYNLAKTCVNSQINLNYLFSGSEGTLAIIGEATLKISPIPKYKKLVLVKYRNFDDALRSHDILDKASPLVVEAIDETLLELAREDGIYFQLKDMLDADVKSGAVNLVEFVSQDEESVNQAIKTLCSEIALATSAHSPIGYYIAKNDNEIKLLWELRKKSVGLVSKRQQGTRRPIPFIEDTAVPPEKLADYIGEFKKILDQHHLIYGMYGHVDAGCVHVRPALDLKQSEDDFLFKRLSDQIAALVEKMGGVMWGEHGMGFRCHYAEQFFGEELYLLVKQIKTLFDPYNRLNPGKIATPVGSQDQLVKLMEPLRAESDKQVSLAWQKEFSATMACNGNGACFSYNTAEVMCPSYKVTKDRIHSPKGRASVMREWLRLLSKPVQSTSSDFAHEVYAAMNGCLSCKACATQCPLSVDVPEMKSKFLSYYHQRYSRPLRDHLIAATEKIAVMQSRLPRFSSWIMHRRVTQWLVKKIGKMVDVPSVSLKQVTSNWDLKLGTPLKTENSVILLQDAFTSFYEAELVIKIKEFLTSLGVTVYTLPFFANGKPLYVKGFLDRFSKTAKRNIHYLREIAKTNIPMIGIDPSITLTYRDEYKKSVGNEALGFTVKLLQEWLIDHCNTPLHSKENKHYYLLSHCTEKSTCVAAEKQWQDIFTAFGLTLTPYAVGCCGMAGSYGHEAEHVQQSKALFAMDWERHLRDNSQAEMTLLATGYSCRSQVKRLKGIRLQHPIEALLHHRNT